MDRSKFIAIVTGTISVAIAIAYLLLVQFLDLRGPMLPAPSGFVSFSGQNFKGFQPPYKRQYTNYGVAFEQAEGSGRSSAAPSHQF